MRRLIALLLPTLLAGCGGGSSKAGARDTLTERQRDSILAQSQIPGATGVGRAMKGAGQGGHDEPVAEEGELEGLGQPAHDAL